jgi:hypothetical protein
VLGSILVREGIECGAFHRPSSGVERRDETGSRQLAATEREVGMKGSEKPKKLHKKQPLKTLKERRSEKRAARKQKIGDR